MIAVATVIDRVQKLIRSEHLKSDQLLVLLQNRYEELYETMLWSHRLRDFTISLVAQTSSTTSDTVSATNGSATITSAGTPFTSAMTGRQIQMSGDEMYYFFTFATSATGTLSDGEGNSVTWPKADTSGMSWRIFKTIYTLPSDAGSVLSLGVEQSQMTEIDGGRSALDQADANRQEVNDPPTHWCYAGVNSSGVREIEVWPVPSAARLVRGQYSRQAPTLTLTTSMELPGPIIVAGLAADAFGQLYAYSGDEAYQRQSLFWERKMQELRDDYRPLEQERLSLPQSINRGPSRLGGDYYVTHLGPGDPW